jgi:hypothetical protein
MKTAGAIETGKGVAANPRNTSRPLGCATHRHVARGVRALDRGLGADAIESTQPPIIKQCAPGKFSQIRLLKKLAWVPGKIL